MSDPKYFAYVDCNGDSEDRQIKGCGTRGLTKEQYERQLNNPWATWRCPCCGGEALYNDTLSEQAQGISSVGPVEDWPASICI